MPIVINSIDMNIWHGRIDKEEDGATNRWHQNIAALPTDLDEICAPVILGFECDEGVTRNQGRPGAKDGPNTIRRALANLACTENFQAYEAGNVRCENADLENAQLHLSERIFNLLKRKAAPIILGGGHEIAWPSFWGAQKYLENDNKELGIINFDAHFDLRNPKLYGSSGTPFRQAHEFCQSNTRNFHYFVLGLNPSANTESLFQYATDTGTKWVTDTALECNHLDEISHHLEQYIKKLDYLYLTICLDVFNASFAPGVSAPAAVGITPTTGIRYIQLIKEICKINQVQIIVSDIAEMNPIFDQDERTSRLAARLIYEIIN